MRNYYNGIKKEYKRKKRRIKSISNAHKKTAIGESLLFALKLSGALIPVGLGALSTKSLMESLNDKTPETSMTSDLEVSKTVYRDNEEIEGKKSAIYEYSPFIEMPDGTYMRTIKIYDPSDKDADDISDILKENPGADIKDFFGEPIETTSEVVDSLLGVDNVNKHYTAKIYNILSNKDKALIIGALSLFDLLLGLASYGIFAITDPDDTIDDLKCDIETIRDNAKDIKKERAIYQEQKREVKTLRKKLKL